MTNDLDTIILLKRARNALRESIFYSESCGLSGARHTVRKADKIIRDIDEHLKTLEPEVKT
jgi:hypothetical protein